MSPWASFCCLALDPYCRWYSLQNSLYSNHLGLWNVVTLDLNWWILWSHLPKRASTTQTQDRPFISGSLPCPQNPSSQTPLSRDAGLSLYLPLPFVPAKHSFDQECMPTLFCFFLPTLSAFPSLSWTSHLLSWDSLTSTSNYTLDP